MPCEVRERLLKESEEALDALVAASRAKNAASAEDWPAAHQRSVVAGQKLSALRAELWHHQTVVHPDCK
jgi:hypothetical protein